MSELLWVAVPGGMDAGRGVLRVLVVPKLDGETVGGSGMGAWPPVALVDDGSVTVEWRADESSPVVPTTLTSADMVFEHQEGLWSEFFPADTVVGTGRRLPLAREPEVRRTSEEVADIDATFASAARTAIDPQAPAPPPEFELGTLEGLRRWQEDDVVIAPPPTPLAPPRRPDFHRVVNLLREHPLVLRALGLVFALRVTPPAGSADGGQVRVVWTGASAAGPDLPPIVSPWTRFGRAFLPASDSGTISTGMVTLTPDADAPDVPGAGDSARWQVATVDVQGGVRKLRDAAKLLAPASGDGTPASLDPRLPATLPAMRTAGLQLVRAGRQQDFERRRGVADANLRRGSLDGHVLDADDLVLGYRIDIRRGGGDWKSLHERVANYDFAGAPIGPPDTLEEGHVKINGAVLEDDGMLRADEVVARWSGWSLSVRRPRFDGDAAATRPVRVGGLPFGFRFEVPPRSLPALRFTATYDLRARVVDMAGGGLALNDPAADRCAITEIAYGRYEPVPSPGLTLPETVETVHLGPGEAVDQIVVRSAPDVSVEDFAAQNPGYRTHARRLIHCPHAPLDLAEQHGMLDGVDDDRTFAWVQRALLASSSPDGAEDGPLRDPAAGGVRAFPRPEPGSSAASTVRREWAERWPEPSPAKTLELRSRRPGEAPVVFDGDTLVVRLEPAEQMSLDLSSFLTENFLDHFALQETLPSLSKDAAKAGRHPLVTPARTVTLVHAVRTPRSTPGGSLVSRTRQPGQTFAVLDPDPTFLGIDANSTARVDFVASWKERTDDKEAEVAGSTIDSLDVDRGATAFGREIRHEFGDSRYRRVNYTARAVSRFRPFFKPDAEGEEPKAFLADSDALTVDVPSTGRPPAPVVIAARPAFVWTERIDSVPDRWTVHRRRAGGGVRVELMRPWYQTGDGERLVVLLWDRTGGITPPGDMRGLVTEVGRDPIWDADGPERWPAAQTVVGAVGEAAAVVIPEIGKPVLAVPYEPWFHDDRWYADVLLPAVATSSYCPFVRLAVARFQAHSIADHHLSPVVRTDMVPLLPERSLTVTRREAALSVRLDGLGPAGPVANRIDVVLERCDAPSGVAVGAVDLTAFAATRGNVPAWVPVDRGMEPGSLGETQTIPLGALSAETVRVRVREVERIGGVPTAPKVGTPEELTERVTFTDTVVVPTLA